MKVQGTEKELRKLFEEEKEPWFKLPKFKKPMTKENKHNLNVFLVTFGIAVVVIFGFWFLMEINNDYITKTDCNIQSNSQVLEALALQEENYWLSLFYIYELQIKFMMIAIAIAWIVHGVGFHVIKR